MIIRELVHNREGNILRHVEPGLVSGLYKILVPKDTHVWRTGITTYLYDEPASAILSFDVPPIGSGTPCGPDTREVLNRLWAGAILSFDSPARSGSLMLSQPENTSPFRAEQDRWLYLQLNFPAGKALNWTSQIDLYPNAAPSTDPSLELAQRTLAYAHEAKLVAALMQTAKATTDEQLIDWMLDQGDLWFAICRLVGIAETQRK